MLDTYFVTCNIKPKIPCISCYLFLIMDVTWATPSSSCHCDFSVVVDCNLELWTKIRVFLHEVVLFRGIRKLLLCLVTSHLPLFSQELRAEVLPRVGKSIHDNIWRSGQYCTHRTNYSPLIIISVLWFKLWWYWMNYKETIEFRFWWNCLLSMVQKDVKLFASAISRLYELSSALVVFFLKK